MYRNLFSELIDLYLREDLEPSGDITSNLIIPESATTSLYICSRKDSGVMSGESFIKQICKQYDPSIGVNFLIPSSHGFKAYSPLVKLTGNARSLLSLERLLLNTLQRAISIATNTQKYVNMVKETNIKIVETRKTTPGLRLLEKQAVLDGGGYNHRYNLSTGVLIKDNHIAIAGGVQNALEAALKNKPHLIEIEIEVDSIEQLKQIQKHLGSIKRVLLDNFRPKEVNEAASIIRKLCEIEISGNINLENIQQYKSQGTQIDYISIGGLTYNVPTLDIGMDLPPTTD